jgi:hypothetical protein
MCHTGSTLNMCIVIIIENDDLQLYVALSMELCYVLMTAMATL